MSANKCEICSRIEREVLALGIFGTGSAPIYQMNNFFTSVCVCVGGGGGVGRRTEYC